MIKNQRKYWNGVADEKEFTTPFQIEVFSKYLPKDARILDFGCGYGRTLFSLYNEGYQNTVGIDISEKMIARGKSIHPYLNLNHLITEEIPFKDESFDAVLALALFTCIPFKKQQQITMSEIWRVLKPGGYLYMNDFLITPNIYNRERYLKFEKKYQHYGIFELPDGGVFRHHSEEEIFKLVRNFQLIIADTSTFKTMNGHLTNGIFYFGKKKY
ncbi:class I SAM-dependent methyltransferase [Candidatus Harpocratesius sp.]